MMRKIYCQVPFKIVLDSGKKINKCLIEFHMKKTQIGGDNKINSKKLVTGSCQASEYEKSDENWSRDEVQIETCGNISLLNNFGSFAGHCGAISTKFSHRDALFIEKIVKNSLFFQFLHLQIFISIFLPFISFYSH